jgi:hypothetical protein
MPQVDREPVDATRIRRLPKHFAWADHRLRDRLAGLSLQEIALLFFLHLAADKSGCSYRADAAIGKKLGMSEGLVVDARMGLTHKGYIAYRYPLYQLLEFDNAQRRP